MTDSELHARLANLALDRAEQAYAESLDLFRDMEGKATGNMTVAGLFLAGAFGFIGSMTANSTALERLLLAIAVTALGATITAASCAVRIRLVRSIPSGPDLAEMARDLMELYGEPDPMERLRRLKLDLTRAWNAASSQLDGVNARKADWIRWSQTLLGTSASFTMGAVLCRLLGGF